MKRISMKNKIGLLAGMGAGLSLLTLAPNANAQTATLCLYAAAGQGLRSYSVEGRAAFPALRFL